MYINVTCDQCFRSFKVAARFAGKKGRCPNNECQSVFRVPELDRSVEEDEFDSPAASHRQQLPPRAQLKRQPSQKTNSGRGWVLPVSATGGTLLLALVIWTFVSGDNPAPELTTDASAGTDPQSMLPPPTAMTGGTETEEEKMQKLGLEKVKRLEPVAMQDDTEFPQMVKPFLEKYCIDCHTGAEAMAGIGLDEYPDKIAVLDNRKIFEKVFGMMQIGAMPPKDYEPQPTEAEQQQVIAWLDDALHNIDCNMVDDPGRVTIRRLNIVEYNNTIRDLFGKDLKPGKDFPADDVGEGFDNIGDVLSLPPLLMEKYLDAAEVVSNEIIVDTRIVPSVRARRRDIKTEGSAGADDREIRFPSTGTATIEFDIPQDGDYVLNIRASASQAGDQPAKMIVKLDGQDYKTVDVDNENDKNFDFPLQRNKGKLVVSLTFPNDFYDPDNKNPKRRDRNLFVDSVVLDGPAAGIRIEPPKEHAGIVLAEPSETLTVKQAATKVFEKFLPRAFRRPVQADELNRFVELVAGTVDEGETYEQGIRLGIQAALVSPSFLFRVEADPQPDNPDYGRKLHDYEIASRLSYFIWSSMPDEELFQLAAEGKLTQPTVLEAQARRMLADPKSKALVDNFGGQWLNLRNLEEIDFSRRRYPDFNSELRRDMVRETLTFFETLMREDGNLLDFLDGKYTFVNERLAKLYGIPNVSGEEFRKVSLENTPRAGVLTHASILALTSNPTRTSPVKRGKWIMENILGTPPPPPPPNVPPLEEAEKASPDATLAEQLALHRKDPGCASCHNVMDPLGLAFEKFDAIGKFRERDGRSPIDDSGVLPGGKEFRGAGELIAILKQREREFATNFTEKMLTYALGRGLRYYDSCAVDHIVESLQQDNYRFSRLIVELVKSDPFLKKRGDGGVE